MRRWPALLVVVFCVAAACTHSSSKATQAKPRPGGVLRIGVTRVGSLDPAQARTVEQLLVADQLFDALTAPNPNTLEPQPSLADRWQASTDQKQWDFFLRSGAKFANGRGVTAADVKYTLERIAKPATASPAADLLTTVAGYAPFVAGTAADLAGITAPTPRQVHIVLDSPLAVLPSLLSSPVFGVVPREAVEAASPRFADGPVGSGPFRYTSTAGDVINLVPVQGRTSFVAGVQIDQYDDVAASYRDFQAGRLDWSRVPPDEVARAAARFGDGAFRPYMAELFYGFNLKSPKLADPRFRAAIVHAIDRQAIVKAVYSSTVLPMNGLIVKGVAGHVDDACGLPCAHDPAQAKALVSTVFGASAPPELFIDYDVDETQTAVAKAIQAGLGDAGIKATLRPKPLKDYQAFAVSGQQELFRLGWIGAFPSPDAFLQPLFATGSSSNLTGLATAGVDQALAAARAEPDGAKRLADYQAAERQVMAVLPVVPLAQFELHSVVGSGVHGLAPTAMGTFDASVVWLSRAPAVMKQPKKK